MTRTALLWMAVSVVSASTAAFEAQLLSAQSDANKAQQHVMVCFDAGGAPLSAFNQRMVREMDCRRVAIRELHH